MQKAFKNMKDEELDQLFKNAADEYQMPAAPPGAWDEFFEKKLHKGNGQKKTGGTDHKRVFFPPVLFKKGVWQAAAVLLLISGGVWFFLTQKKENTHPDRSVVSDVIKKENEKTIVSQPTQDTLVTGQAGVVVKTGVSNELQPMLKPQSLVTVFDREVTGNKTWVPGILQKVKPPTVQNEFKVSGNKTDINQQAISLKPNIVQSEPQQRNNNHPYAYNNSPFPVIKSRSYGATGLAKWQLGLLGGSNLGMVHGTVSSKPGVNAGLVVQRRINNSRLSIESGVVYESMAYDVANEYFNPNGKPVSSRVSNIEGTCSMIDIPVNVRYDVVHSKKTNAFVSTGVSPTMVVKQSYIYDYTDETGTRLIDRDVSGKGKSVYSVANISVGFEQKWNKTSVQVAPYVKIPMGEVGYGNLSLGGIGTQVSVKRDL